MSNLHGCSEIEIGYLAELDKLAEDSRLSNRPDDLNKKWEEQLKMLKIKNNN